MVISEENERDLERYANILRVMGMAAEESAGSGYVIADTSGWIGSKILDILEECRDTEEA